MKHAYLRAAAHNIADSISSECSMLAHEMCFPLWNHVERMPDQRLAVDLLSGQILSRNKPFRVRRYFKRFAKLVPAELERHRCDPAQVVAIEIEFRVSRRPLERNEALIFVEQVNGLKSLDRYLGCPLQRPRYLDELGRIRRDRRRPISAIVPSRRAGGPPGR